MKNTSPSRKKRQSYYSIRSFLSFLSRYKLRTSLMMLAFILANIFITVMPIFIGQLIGVLAAPEPDSGLAYTYVAILIFCSVGHSIVWHGSEYIYLKVLLPLSYLYENIVFRQVIDKPYPFFVDKFTGKISSYITTLGDEMNTFISNLYYNYANMLVRLISVSVIMLSVNWQTGLIFTGNLILMLIVGRYTVRNNILYEKRFTDVRSTKNGKIIDAIANFVNVKSFQKEGEEFKIVKKEQRKTLRVGQQSFFWSLMFWSSMSFFVRFVIWPATILFNVHLYLQGDISIAALSTFLSSIVLFAEFIWGVVWNVSQFNLKLAKIEESYRYLFGTTNIVRDYYDRQDSAGPRLNFLSRLSLEKLRFAYPEHEAEPVLDGINLRISKGEKIGIVGKSGSGKTTLTKLLLGYYPIDEAMIELDSEPVNNRELPQLISYVPQDTSLFHRSIAENIAYATDERVSRQDIIKAAKQAHADEFITQIEDGYDALVGERGVKLSAGQRQRIAIARAFLDNKPILILDEATSALDSESEVLVQEALEALWQDKTVIAIAHRLSTLRNMDRIIVLDKGTIIESGSHEELLAHNGKYAELWAHQSGGFLEED